jgi:RNA polymerase sigma-70 factor (ECF subfamily)
VSQQLRIVPTTTAYAEERTLVDGCRAGDRRALDRFFRTHVQRVERTIGRLVGPTPDLEDLVQSTFVEAMRGFARFRGEASLATWVTRIAVHVAQHQLRRGLRRNVPLELLPDADEPRDPARNPEHISDDREIALRLHAALDRVKPKKRIAFLLFAVEGHSIEEVAALTGSSQAATKSRIWFARRELTALAKKDPILRELACGLGEEGGRCSGGCDWVGCW